MLALAQDCLAGACASTSLFHLSRIRLRRPTFSNLNLPPPLFHPSTSELVHVITLRPARVPAQRALPDV